MTDNKGFGPPIILPQPAPQPQSIQDLEAEGRVYLTPRKRQPYK